MNKIIFALALSISVCHSSDEVYTNLIDTNKKIETCFKCHFSCIIRDSEYDTDQWIKNKRYGQTVLCVIPKCIADCYTYKGEFAQLENIDNKEVRIIEFSKKNKAFLIYFTNNFWKFILSCYNEPNQDNIYICFQFRNIFKADRKFEKCKFPRICLKCSCCYSCSNCIIPRYIKVNDTRKARTLCSVESLEIFKYHNYSCNKNSILIIFF